MSFCGDLDLIGTPKAQARLRRVLWGVSRLELSVHRPQPEAEVIGAWGFRDERQSWAWPTVPEGTPLLVRAYARSGCVRLTLNGRAAGGASNVPAAGGGDDRRARARAGADAGHAGGGQQWAAADCTAVGNATSFEATWLVPYHPGRLEATLHEEGGDGGGGGGGGGEAAVAAVALTTSGPPARLRLTAERPVLAPRRSDLSFVLVEVLDASGELVECGGYDAADALPEPAWCQPLEVHFALSGDPQQCGELAAVGSGDPLDLGSFSATSRRTYRGRALAVLRPGLSGGAAPPVAPCRLTLKAAVASQAIEPAVVTVDVAASHGYGEFMGEELLGA